jgi:hypothetical protein
MPLWQATSRLAARRRTHDVGTPMAERRCGPVALPRPTGCKTQVMEMGEGGGGEE